MTGHVVYYMGGPMDLCKEVMPEDHPEHDTMRVVRKPAVTMKSAPPENDTFVVTEEIYYLRPVGRDPNGRRVFIAKHESISGF